MVPLYTFLEILQGFEPPEAVCIFGSVRLRSSFELPSVSPPVDQH